MMQSSDKVYWHNYINFYEGFFAGKSFSNIVEIGVLNGNSMRWLLERFPEARIYGADIVPLQENWPRDPRICYVQMDQGDAAQVRKLFSLAAFDLIIEDGSHRPDHQITALVEGIRSLNNGGIYILEDIHTSHPRHKEYAPQGGTALSVLLAIDHYKRLSMEIDLQKAARIASDSLLSVEDVLLLAENISAISLYKRTNLPDRCYRCGSVEFNYSAYKCLCGVDLFEDADSMSFVIQKRR